MRDDVRYAVGLDSTVDRLVEAKTAPLREALKALVDRLDEINASPEFKGVWVDALERARAAVTAPTKSR
jgi:hypothetical protein